MISNILGRAWNLTTGAKWPIWAVLLVAGAILIPLILLVSYFSVLLFGEPVTKHPFFTLAITFIEYLIIAPFVGGALMTALKRAREEKINAATGFQYFHKYLVLVVTLIAINIFSYIPVFLVNLFGGMGGETTKGILDLLATLISLGLYSLFSLSILLVVDKNLNPQQALLTSIEKVKPYWPKVFLLFLITSLYFIGSLLPLMLGLMLKNTAIIILGAVIWLILFIWIMPLVFLIQALIYRKLMGKEQ